MRVSSSVRSRLIFPAVGDPPGCGVGNDQKIFDGLAGAAAEVFHPGFVVDDHIVVVVAQGSKDVPQQVVGVAVASRALGPSHGDQVEIRCLDQAGLDLVFEELLLGHPAGQL